MSTFKPSWIFSPSPSLRNLSLFWKVFTRSYRLVIITLEKQKHWFELITQALDELIFGKKKINIKIRGIGWRQTWGNDVVQSHTSFKGQTVLGFPANENYREFFVLVFRKLFTRNIALFRKDEFCERKQKLWWIL